ncbi:MAG: Abi-alpha family protein, partial [Cyanobacteria bacterium P01_F01_bin.116]
PGAYVFEPIINVGYTSSKEKIEFIRCWYVTNLAVDAKCKFPDLDYSYIQNLCRLGLFEMPTNQRITEELQYERLKKHKDVEKVKKSLPEGAELKLFYRAVGLTAFGDDFRKAVIFPNHPIYENSLE